MHALKADTHRVFGRYSRALVLKGFLLRSSFRVLVTLRLCQAAHQLSPPLRSLLLLPAKVLHGLSSQLAGIEIPWRTHIGPGAALTHGRGIVVNVNARIGSNVTLFHGVTLGQRDRIDERGQRVIAYPVIEDDVWIGPYAIITGGITIGHGSRIAGGACVFESVPERCVVVGNPATIVKRNCTPDVDNRYVADTSASSCTGRF
ncbi:MAG: serine O-acetyltransferase [Polaromonas sp.]|nr:serine O-acetyltransferase [Polaromonas sp.]